MIKAGWYMGSLHDPYIGPPRPEMKAWGDMCLNAGLKTQPVEKNVLKNKQSQAKNYEKLTKIVRISNNGITEGTKQRIYSQLKSSRKEDDIVNFLS